MSTLSTRLRQNLSLWPVHTVLPPQIEQAFAEQCRARFDHHAKILTGVVLAMTFIWWPTDRLVFRAFPELSYAMNRWRIGIALASALYILLPRPPVAMRHILFIFSAAACACCWTAGSTAGLMGGLEKPYFHILYVLVLATVNLPLLLGQRVFLTLLIAVVTASGYFVPYPAHLASPYLLLCLSFLLCVVVLSVWFGHVHLLLARENFFQAHELSEHGRLLEERVMERTFELRRLLHHVETARESERKRVARELHDELGQELSALRYSLGFTRKRYETEPGAIAANLDELDDLLRRTSVTTRNLVAELRPRVLDDLGLPAAVKWLIERTEARSNLTCQAKISEELMNLDATVATAAFRILQEALTNIVRHAAAQHVEIEVTTCEGFLELKVADDGIGLQAAQVRANQSGGHVGLIGMRERGHALGGSLHIVERPSGGTEVRCRLPLVPSTADKVE